MSLRPLRAVILLLGVCFVCVTLYCVSAKPEIVRRARNRKVTIHNQKWPTTLYPVERDVTSSKFIFGITLCVWRRLELTRAALQALYNLRKRLEDCCEIYVAIAGSEGAVSQALCEDFPSFCVGYVEVPNNNEVNGRKWNAGFRVFGMLEFRVNGIMILAGDDFLNEALFREYVRLVKLGASYIGFLDFLFYNSASHQLYHWTGYKDSRRLLTLGAARFLVMDCCELLDFDLFDENDYSEFPMDRKLIQLGKIHPSCDQPTWKRLRMDVNSKAEFPAFIDVKTHESVTAPSHLERNSNLLSPSVLRVSKISLPLFILGKEG